MSNRQITCIAVWVLWLISVSSQAFAQTSYWNHTYDLDGGNEYGTSIRSYQDMLVIAVFGFCDINSRDCSGIISLDSTGEEVWKHVVYDTLSFNYVESILVVGDTIFTNMNYLGIDDREYIIYKLSADDGTLIGSQDYYQESNITGHYVAQGITGDTSKIIVGFGIIPDSSVPGEHFIRAYDFNENQLWEVGIPNVYENPAWYDIEATYDGGMAVGYTSWESGTGNRKGTIEKYDSLGNFEWQTNLPYHGDFEDWMKIDLSPDSGYVGLWLYDTFAISMNPEPYIVFKLDKEGDIVWERVEDYFELFDLYDIFSTKSGDIIACGTAENWPGEPRYRSAYIVRYNSDGDQIWDRRIVLDSSVYFQGLYGGIELPNGDLVFTGEVCDTIFGTPDDPTPCNVWVIKVDSNGCFSPDCGEFQYLTGTSDIESARRENLLAVFPNPASREVTIATKLGDPFPRGLLTLYLYDMLGTLIHSEVFDPRMLTTIDVSGYPQGNYFLSIQQDGKIVQSEMISIIR